MPLFSVTCENCNECMEVITKVDEITVCPKCGQTMVRLLPDTFNFRLKYTNSRDKVSWGAEGYASSQYYKEQDKLAKGNIFAMPGSANDPK